MTVPYRDLERRVRDLELYVNRLEKLVREQLLPKRVEPLYGRLWGFSLNENVGATTAGQAAADLLALDGTDTGKDVTLTVNTRFNSMVNGDTGDCIEQLDVDGARHYVVIQGDC